MIYLYVYGKENRWGCTLRNPKTGKMDTHYGTHPTRTGEQEMTRLAVYVGLSLLKRPCPVKIFGVADWNEPRCTKTDAPELKQLAYLCY